MTELWGPVYGLLLVRALQARWRIFNSELDIKLSRILGFGNFVPSTYTPVLAKQSQTPASVRCKGTSVLCSKILSNGELRRQVMSIWSELPCKLASREIGFPDTPLEIPCSIQRSN
jgi:hypothetical protein